MWLVTRHEDVEEALRDPRDVLPAADLVDLPGPGHAVPLEDPAAVADLIRTTVARGAAPAPV
jgi:pimeloyl-ACP methyl ester carboxylesterase